MPAVQAHSSASADARRRSNSATPAASSARAVGHRRPTRLVQKGDAQAQHPDRVERRLLMQARQGFQAHAFVETQAAHAGAPERRHVRGTAERHPYVAGERADVGALRHVEGHVPHRLHRRIGGVGGCLCDLHALKARIIHFYVARRKVDDASFARGVARLNPAHLDGGVHGRHLAVLPHQAGDEFFGEAPVERLGRDHARPRDRPGASSVSVAAPKAMLTR